MNMKKAVRSVLRVVIPKPLRDPVKTLFNKFFWRGIIYDEVSYSLFYRIPLFKIRWTEDGSHRTYLIFMIPVVTICTQRNRMN